MSRTTVVSVRGKTGAELARLGVVYVGRPVRSSPHAAVRRGSIWGNPYRLGHDGDIVEVLAAYRRHLLASPDLLALLHTLRGWVLGCWCVDDARDPPCAPEDYRCHAQIIAELADGPLGEPPAGGS